MAQITVSEALGLVKTLKERHGELKSLRDENANKERRFYGVGGDKTTEKVPVYSVKKLDQTVNRLSLEIRRIDTALKAHNAATKLEGYEWDDAVLGVIETE